VRVLVCGDRKWSDANLINARLDVLPRADLVIIEGEANGADTFARLWAKARHVPYLPFPADWDQYHRAAGPIRNRTMLRDGRPDRVYAFHDHIESSRGTADMVAAATKAGVPVTIFSHHGEEHR